MSREEQLIKEFEKYVNDNFSRREIELMMGCASYAHSHPLWFKVSENLPPKDDELWSTNVLVTDGESIQFGFYDHINNQWHVLGVYDNNKYNITHWMYLPQLPQED